MARTLGLSPSLVTLSIQTTLSPARLLGGEFMSGTWSSGVVGPGWKAAGRLAARRKQKLTWEQRLKQLEEREAIEEEMLSDNYPYNGDWDDHDVDWGETR